MGKKIGESIVPEGNEEKLETVVSGTSEGGSEEPNLQELMEQYHIVDADPSSDDSLLQKIKAAREASMTKRMKHGETPDFKAHEQAAKLLEKQLEEDVTRLVEEADKISDIDPGVLSKMLSSKHWEASHQEGASIEAIRDRLSAWGVKYAGLGGALGFAVTKASEQLGTIPDQSPDGVAFFTGVGAILGIVAALVKEGVKVSSVKRKISNMQKMLRYAGEGMDESFSSL